MIEVIEVPTGPSLDDYATSMHLTDAVAELRSATESITHLFEGRTVWLVNSTARGGGVAEMLPRQMGIMEELGIRTRWAVMGTDRHELFHLTKRLHNLLHGMGDPHISDADRSLYEEVSRELQSEFEPMVGPEDILLIHDPQPAGLGALVKGSLGIPAVWRCHIGLDDDVPATRVGWSLLEPYVSRYDRTIFSAEEYVPPFLSDRSGLVRPALDPFSDKNQYLATQEIVDVLGRAGLTISPHPLLSPPFSRQVERLQPDGSFKPATTPDDLRILHRPMIMQISRWDRLKGWAPLMKGFELFKGELFQDVGPQERRMIEQTGLLLVGPESAAVQDDPEAVEVLDELCNQYRRLPEEVRKDVALLSLPMEDQEENARIVNALQSSVTVVVQNSVREGFGLTATEPMWKGTPVLVSNACGLRQQIRPGTDGDMILDPQDPVQVARALQRAVCEPDRRAAMARSAQRRVREEFLVFTQVAQELRILAQTLRAPLAR
jgi:trehalose synthase